MQVLNDPVFYFLYDHIILFWKFIEAICNNSGIAYKIEG